MNKCFIFIKNGFAEKIELSKRQSPTYVCLKEMEKLVLDIDNESIGKEKMMDATEKVKLYDEVKKRQEITHGKNLSDLDLVIVQEEEIRYYREKIKILVEDQRKEANMKPYIKSSHVLHEQAINRYIGRRSNFEIILEQEKEIRDLKKQVENLQSELANEPREYIPPIKELDEPPRPKIEVEVHCSDVYQAKNAIDNLIDYGLYLKIIVDPNFIKNT